VATPWGLRASLRQPIGANATAGSASSLKDCVHLRKRWAATFFKTVKYFLNCTYTPTFIVEPKIKVDCIRVFTRLQSTFLANS